MEKIKNELQNIEINTIQELNELRIKYIGKKGIITNLYNKLKDLNSEEKKEYGKNINELKQYFDEIYINNQTKLEEKELQSNKEHIDLTLPSTNMPLGMLHVLNKVREEIEEVFISMGYDIVDGFEIESDLYNFELLNFEKDHPARDSQDTFIIDKEYLLRTHTSPQQIRTMLQNKEKTPIRIIVPGKVYRKDDDDQTHSHQFMQLECLLIDENISLAHLKGTLETFLKKIFNEDTKIRFRPSYFPFTEPSLEVDISCFNCKHGCSMCKNTTWIEILGCGMVHPNVLKNGGYDPKKYTGFAFGVGLERIAMLKYQISDIRHFYNNDLRFLNQFNKVEGDL